MKRFLERLMRFKWNRLTPVVIILMGYSSCAICGGSTDLHGKNVCTPFSLKSVVTLPNNPVTVTWNPAEAGYIDQYRIEITNSKSQLLGEAITDGSTTSAVITLDSALLSQTMATDKAFGIEGFGALSNGYGVGDCEFDSSISLGTKAHDKSAPHGSTSTSTPIPTVPASTGGSSCTFSVQNFSASSNSIKSGGSSTLSWSVSGIQTVSVNGQGVTGQGSMTVSPTSTTTYSLVMNCGGQTQSRSVTVTVTTNAPTATATLPPLK